MCVSVQTYDEFIFVMKLRFGKGSNFELYNFEKIKKLNVEALVPEATSLITNMIIGR